MNREPDQPAARLTKTRNVVKIDEEKIKQFVANFLSIQMRLVALVLSDRGKEILTVDRTHRVPFVSNVTAYMNLYLSNI